MSEWQNGNMEVPVKRRATAHVPANVADSACPVPLMQFACLLANVT